MDETPPVPGVGVAAYRWWIHLVLLALYPVVLGLVGFASAAQSEAPMLPEGTTALLMTCAVELLVFGAVFAIVVLISGASRSELLVSWRGGLRPVWRGFLYSLLLRGVIMVATVLVAIAAYVISGGSTAALERLRPEVENIIDAKALADPLYFALTLTLVSFVVAGFREELWRAGMLAAFRALFPFLLKRRGHLVAAAAIAVVFGLGHLSQGIGGVLMTTALGFGLGWIMIRHGSVWDAVFAHGFFNATTFLFLYLLTRQ